MAPQEAIEILKNGSFSAQQTLRARKIAISAIERLIPKKVVVEGITKDVTCCPNCTEVVDGAFCPECGQALDYL